MEKKNEEQINILYDYITNEEFFEADLYTIYQEVMGRDLTILYTYNIERYRGRRNDFDIKNTTFEQVTNSDESELEKE